MNNRKREIPEAKSLRWLANQFPFEENPKDDTDKLCNCINIYCTDGANKIEELQELLDSTKKKIEDLQKELGK